ncbi:MAG TPA: MarR family transcriptional regulator [Candidatus Acidoferrales bacterium]|jgi:DNA-binding MarR family transcriptional regulator|nr:MarR family transcriptional regulator [Candidatus Acidoferrales bacterium]
MQDRIDRILAQWSRERPDLDTKAMGLVGRIQRAAAALRPRLDDTHGRCGLAGESFDVLASLRRSGRPYQLSPTQLYREMMLTSGAMTNRVDRLEAAGLVSRRPDPQDRRGTLVRLTPKGKALIDAATSEHVANEGRLLAGLNAREQLQLGELLRKLLLSLGDAGD